MRGMHPKFTIQTVQGTNPSIVSEIVTLSAHKLLFSNARDYAQLSRVNILSNGSVWLHIFEGVIFEVSFCCSGVDAPQATEMCIFSA